MSLATDTLDVRKIRSDFSILQRSVRGKPLVYLDNTATSQKPRRVLDALQEFYETINANIHRGVYRISEMATEHYEAVRKKIATLIGADSPSEIIFSRGTTESINLVSRAWGDKFVRAGDEILVTEMEHHSNLIPWQLLARRAGATLRWIPITDDGKLDLAAAQRLIGPRTRILAVTALSNVLGTINPVAELARSVHEAGGLVLVDGAQSVAHLPQDVRALGCDFLAASGHKMCGPTGVGFLYGRHELLESMDPFLGGGEMIREVWMDRATWNEVPWKFEAGTMNIAQVVGLGVAVDYLTEIGMDRIRDHEQSLAQYAMKELAKVRGIKLYGPYQGEERGGLVAFSLAGIHPHDLATIVDEQDGVAIRAGHHCAQPLMRRLGVPATARASFYLYNLPEEVDILVRSLENARKFLGCA